MNLQTTIFRCSKNYGIPTRVTRLKVAPNMPDPTSIKHSVSSLIGRFTKTLQHTTHSHKVVCLFVSFFFEFSNLGVIQGGITSLLQVYQCMAI